MTDVRRAITAALAAGALAAAAPALAGDENGNFMVRVLGTVVDPDTDATVSAGGAVLPGADADVSTEVVPALTLTYFLTKNVAVELFCCFARHEVEGEGILAPLGDIAETWIFPPALTLQYHFDRWGSFKPYVGAGLQYSTSSARARATTGSVRPTWRSTTPSASRCRRAWTSRSGMGGI